MQMFEWTEELSIDDGFIDADHQKLIEIANRVMVLDQPEKDTEALTQAIRELYNYVEYHFTREVDFMRHVSYPEVDSHQSKHQAILKQMNQLLNTSQHMGEILENFQALMEDWVLRHIKIEDVKLSAFMESR